MIQTDHRMDHLKSAYVYLQIAAAFFFHCTNYSDYGKNVFDLDEQEVVLHFFVVDKERHGLFTSPLRLLSPLKLISLISRHA